MIGYYSMLNMIILSFVLRYLTHYDTFLLSVDGVWGEWEDWSDCTVTCGEGTSKRIRECTGPEHGGKECEGDPSEQRICNKEVPCPGELYSYTSPVKTWRTVNMPYKVVNKRFMTLWLIWYNQSQGRCPLIIRVRGIIGIIVHKPIALLFTAMR